MFHRDLPSCDPPITISRTGSSPSLTCSLPLQLTPTVFNPGALCYPVVQRTSYWDINPLRGLWGQSPYQDGPRLFPPCDLQQVHEEACASLPLSVGRNELISMRSSFCSLRWAVLASGFCIFQESVTPSSLR